MERRTVKFYKGEKYIPTVDELLKHIKDGATLEELWLHYGLDRYALGRILAQKEAEYKATKRFVKYEARLKAEPELMAKLEAFMALVEKQKGIPTIHGVRSLLFYNRSMYGYFVEKAKAKGYELPGEEESEEIV